MQVGGSGTRVAEEASAAENVDVAGLASVAGIANDAVVQMLVRSLDGQDKLYRALTQQTNKKVESKVEGISMPKYHGKLGESVDMFFWQAKVFFTAKNIDYKEPANQNRCLAMIVANLRDVAASWYQDRVNSSNQHPTDLTSLKTALEQEFVPADMQDRLRDKMYLLRQKHCHGLHDYVGRYREIAVQIKDMSEKDKVTYFLRGLMSRTKAEVKYRRCGTVSDAIAVALEYERSHSELLNPPNHVRSVPKFDRNRPPRRNEERPHRIDGNHVRVEYNDVAKKNKLCFNCHGSDHQSAKCKLPKRRRSQAPKFFRIRQNHVKIDTSGSDSESVVEVFDVMSINAFKSSTSSAPIACVGVGSDSSAAGSADGCELIGAAGFTSCRVFGSTPGKLGREDLGCGYGSSTTVTVNSMSSMKSSDLVLVDLVVNGKNCVGLVDSGANHNMIDKSLTATKNLLHQRRATIEGFDGSNIQTTKVSDFVETIKWPGQAEHDQSMVFTEWDFASKEYQVILGKPWFEKYDPKIDWKTNRVLSMDIFEDEPTGLLEAEPKLDLSDLMIKITTMKSEVHVPKKLQTVIQRFKAVFPETLPDGLPPSRIVDFGVKLKPDAKPSNRQQFRLSRAEQQALDRFVNKLLKKGWVELSTSPYVSQIFGLGKKDEDGKMPSRREWLQVLSQDPNVASRWVVDYRYINSICEIPKIPLPNIEELFDRMHGCKVFSKMDLASGYHQMLVNPDSRKYTAFRTHNETYQWCVAPQGMAGMPGTWSRLMRLLFGKFDFVIVYLDDICVCSKTIEEHAEHLAIVLKVLEDEKLYVRLDKCEFGMEEISFLGHVIGKDGLKVDPKKVRAVEKLIAPTNRKQLLSFLGLAGYYRKFICDFATLVLPLSELTKDKTSWTWNDEHERAFSSIKLALQQAPVLQLPNYEKPFTVTTDASGRCAGAVLSQVDDASNELPIAFMSKKFSSAECNWPAHEQELYAIKLALAKWRPYLHGKHFDVFTDNSACKWFLNTPILTPKMTRWLDFFGRFDFTLHHRPGRENVVADAFSRLPASDHPSVEEPVSSQISTCRIHHCNDTCQERAGALALHSERAFLIAQLSLRDAALMLDFPVSGERVVPSRQARPIPVGVRQKRSINHASQVSYCTLELDGDFCKRLHKAYKRDPYFQKYAHGKSNMVLKEGLFFEKSDSAVRRLVVPNDDEIKTEIISQFHDAPIADHPGIHRTQQAIMQWYRWPNMYEDIKVYVATCETCQRYKTSSLRPNGELMPIAIPNENWECCTLDWVTGLPVSDGFDSIMCVVCKKSKRAKYVATHTTTDAPKAAHEFFDNVVRHHGLPKTLISDRDPKFISDFWKSLMSIMGIKHSMSTAGRAQTDGQTERQNRTMEDSLRCVVSYLGNDWASHLGTVEYAHMNLVQASTGFTPFEVDTGRSERRPMLNFHDFHHQAARNFAEHRQNIIDMATKNLQRAQEKMKAYYDKRRVDTTFNVKDYVYLATRRIPIKHAQAYDFDGKPTRPKLTPRFIGPFEIIEVINKNAMRLKLPQSMGRMHNVFNVDRLKLAKESPSKFATRPIPKATPVIIDDDGQRLFIVQALLKKRQFNRKVEYLVHWHGENEDEATWELASKIKHVAHFDRLLKDLQVRQQTQRQRRSRTHGNDSSDIQGRM